MRFSSCFHTGMVVFDQSVTKSDKTMTMLLNSNDLVMYNFFIKEQKMKQNEFLLLHGYIVSGLISCCQQGPF